jgi:hypothetical protein
MVPSARLSKSTSARGRWDRAGRGQRDDRPRAPPDLGRRGRRHQHVDVRQSGPLRVLLRGIRRGERLGAVARRARLLSGDSTVAALAGEPLQIVNDTKSRAAADLLMDVLVLGIVQTGGASGHSVGFFGGHPIFNWQTCLGGFLERRTSWQFRSNRRYRYRPPPFDAWRVIVLQAGRPIAYRSRCPLPKDQFLKQRTAAPGRSPLP